MPLPYLSKYCFLSATFLPKMPQFCAVLGCSSRSNREKGKGYYRLPKVITHKGEKWKKLTEQRRKKWIANLRLQTRRAESANTRVCGDHFVNGCPSALVASESVDWAPTVKLGYQNTELMSEGLSEGTQDEGYADAGCQMDLTMDVLEKMEVVIRENLVELGEKVLDCKFTPQSFENNDEKTRFYTGLPNFLVLMQIFRLCEPEITCCPLSVLSKFEQFILVLLRLRLNLPLKDLAFRFNISLSTASRVWYRLIDILYENLEFQLEWPKRHILHDTMPIVFREAFGCKVSVILDCFEVFIERPSNLLAQAQTWSNYKHHSTVKFLIGVAPQGFVTHISVVWGGRVSDKELTIQSGILKNLLPGDIVVADRGFNTSENVGFYCAKLQIPTFPTGRKQLTPFKVAETRKVANLRKHVERVTGLVRRKYQILQSKAMAIENMATKPGEALALIGKIGVICCVLSNMSESIVSLE
ncbi:uncharacterized protein LOC134450456 [Engraulis encrasicolus]|uniref:uncharacterized protein LOC134450456 n=1 Tax=Engraulis encrasicolus TaxID=184585 RepID=UPI002FD26232